MPSLQEQQVNQDAVHSIVHQYYVSTGRKNAMFTLRCLRINKNKTGALLNYMPDLYLCNLATDEDTALEKARRYVKDVQDRFAGDSVHHIQLVDVPERIADKRRGKLSIKDTRRLTCIEAGRFPFGAHEGKPIEDAPADYLLYFADKSALPDNDPVTQTLAMACLGVALEKGYFNARDVKRQAQREEDLLSRHMGKLAERREFKGQVVAAFCVGGVDSPGSYFVTKIRCKNNLIVYKGARALGDVGQTLSLRATVYKHDDYKGIKSTVIKRPSIM